MKTTNFINKLFTEKTSLIIAIVIMIIYFLPFFIFGKDSFVTIHDNLDANVSWMKFILNDNYKQTMNGVAPNNSIYVCYDIAKIIFDVFGIYWGYIFNKILMSIIGFTGMYLLLKQHFNEYDNKYNYLIIYTSLLFSLLPFWSYSMSVSGIPLVLFAFLNIRKGNIKFYNWCLIIFYTFSSSLILVGIFLLFILGLLFLHDIYNRKRYNIYFFLSLILITISYIVSHFPIIYDSFIDSNFTTHRVEFKYYPKSLWKSIKTTILIFINGQYHAKSLNLFIIPVVLFVLIKKNIPVKLNFKYILGFILFSSIFYSFKQFSVFHVFFQKLLTIIPIQLQRIHFLQSIFWYILLFISFKEIIKRYKSGKLFLLFFFIIQIFFVFNNNEFIKGYFSKTPTFNSFYQTDIFNQINNDIDIDKKEYRILNVGIHPAVSQYNGFYTLGGYVPSYSLKYKHLFRRIIEKELDKDIEIKNYFDNFGGRCYAFSSELGKDISSLKSIKINNLDYNYDLLIELNCNFIFSSVQINTSNNKRIKLFKEYSNELNTIFVYEII